MHDLSFVEYFAQPLQWGGIRKTNSVEEVLEMVKENEHILSKLHKTFHLKIFLESSEGQYVPGGETNFGLKKRFI